MRRLSVMLVVAAMLAGCAGERDPDAVETPTVAPAPALSGEPTPAVNPATAGDLDQASYTGYGAIPFGTPVGDMPRLWGGELSVNGKEFNDQCYFMTPVWVKQPAEFNFMVSQGRFARFSTESTRFVAPGGGRVGMSTAEVKRLYPGRIDARPQQRRRHGLRPAACPAFALCRCCRLARLACRDPALGRSRRAVSLACRCLRRCVGVACAPGLGTAGWRRHLPGR